MACNLCMARSTHAGDYSFNLTGTNAQYYNMTAQCEVAYDGAPRLAPSHSRHHIVITGLRRSHDPLCHRAHEVPVCRSLVMKGRRGARRIASKGCQAPGRGSEGVPGQEYRQHSCVLMSWSGGLAVAGRTLCGSNYYVQDVYTYFFEYTRVPYTRTYVASSAVDGSYACVCDEGGVGNGTWCGEQLMHIGDDYAGC